MTATISEGELPASRNRSRARTFCSSKLGTMIVNKGDPTGGRLALALDLGVSAWSVFPEGPAFDRQVIAGGFRGEKGNDAR